MVWTSALKMRRPGLMGMTENPSDVQHIIYRTGQDFRVIPTLDPSYNRLDIAIRRESSVQTLKKDYSKTVLLPSGQVSTYLCYASHSLTPYYEYL